MRWLSPGSRSSLFVFAVPLSTRITANVTPVFSTASFDFLTFGASALPGGDQDGNGFPVELHEVSYFRRRHGVLAAVDRARGGLIGRPARTLSSTLACRGDQNLTLTSGSVAPGAFHRRPARLRHGRTHDAIANRLLSCVQFRARSPLLQSG